MRSLKQPNNSKYFRLFCFSLIKKKLWKNSEVASLVLDRPPARVRGGCELGTHMKYSGEEGLSVLLAEPRSRKPLLSSFSYLSL